jgi:hypothetical protein
MTISRACNQKVHYKPSKSLKILQRNKYKYKKKRENIQYKDKTAEDHHHGKDNVSLDNNPNTGTKAEIVQDKIRLTIVTLVVSGMITISDIYKVCIACTTIK